MWYSIPFLSTKDKKRIRIKNKLEQGGRIMNGFALLGILLFVYAGLVFFVAVKKPKKIWNMGKIEGFKKVLGERGTVIFFTIWGLLAVAVGVWLMTK